MPAPLTEPHWTALGAPGRSAGLNRLDRTARITAHILGWPLLVKVGLLSGFAIASAVQHLLAA